MPGRLEEALLQAAGRDEERQQDQQTALPSTHSQHRHQRRWLSTVALMTACFGLGAFCTVLLAATTAPATAPMLHGPMAHQVHAHGTAAATNTQPSAFWTAPSSLSVAAASSSSSAAAEWSLTLSPAVRRCQKYLDRSFDHQFSLILTADPGDFSGVSEAHYILTNLRFRQDMPRERTVCGGASSGTLLGQAVLVVTTGIGPAAASLCTLEVLSNCGELITQAIYFGTSGWSPQPGGMLNPPACDAANWRPTNVTRTGDVCVSPFSVNWTCKKSSWSLQTEGAPNQCIRPEESAGPEDTPLFGECQFYKDNIKANLRLADKLVKVAASAGAARNFPLRSSNVTAHETEYWSAVAEGARQQLPVLDPSSPPTIWDYNHCMEVDAQFFYSGSPWELKARDYAAQALSAALEHLKQLDGGQQQGGAATAAATGLEHASASDIIAVSAMEGVGVSEALLRYHSLSTTLAPIPFTNVRTLSNWMVQPLVQTRPGVWEVLRQVPEDFVNGYAHAIATGSATILSLYQDMCLGDVAARQGQAGGASEGTECNFVIESQEVVSRLSASGRYGQS